MPKICEVSFKGHPVLGDLTVDFRDDSGEAADTVIIAGENGVGKSTLMNCLYELISGTAKKPIGPVDLVIEENGNV